MPTISGLDVKLEITGMRVKDEECEALLSGYTRVSFSLARYDNASFVENGESVEIVRGYSGVMLELDVQHDFVRDYIAACILKTYKISPKPGEQKLVYADGEKLLRGLCVLNPDSDGYDFMGIPHKYYDYDFAYVRGMFLGCGSLSVYDADNSVSQKGSGYHLEFSFINEGLADELAELLSRHEIVMRKMSRSGKCVLYTKDSQTVCDCLALMGVSKTVLKLHSTLTVMEQKINANRVVNCDMANATRSTVAATNVSEAIEYLDRTVGIDTLDPKLVEAADARKNSPDLSLGELAFELGISKSGLKHRYDKIVELAQQKRAERGEQD